MKQRLTNDSDPDELLRFKKSLQFIQKVISSYEFGGFDHVGFSCAIAISKAEELKERVSPFCRAHLSLERLIEALIKIQAGEPAYDLANRHLEAISAYFGLEKYALVPRLKPL